MIALSLFHFFCAGKTTVSTTSKLISCLPNPTALSADFLLNWCWPLPAREPQRRLHHPLLGVCGLGKGGNPLRGSVGRGRAGSSSFPRQASLTLRHHIIPFLRTAPRTGGMLFLRKGVESVNELRRTVCSSHSWCNSYCLPTGGHVDAEAVAGGGTKKLFLPQATRNLEHLRVSGCWVLSVFLRTLQT